MIALTRLCFNSVTMPARRYQTPSRVRQTSSASILPPLLNRITGLPPSFLPMPGPLVETGATVVRECDVAVRSVAAFDAGVGEDTAFSSGDDKTVATGAGVTTTGAAMLTVVTGGISATSSARKFKLK